MNNTESLDEEEACLCQSFVPEGKRIDFLAVRPNKKTGVPERRVVLRYHKDCPDHGTNEKIIDSQPIDPSKPRTPHASRP